MTSFLPEQCLKDSFELLFGACGVHYIFLKGFKRISHKNQVQNGILKLIFVFATVYCLNFVINKLNPRPSGEIDFWCNFELYEMC